MHRHFLVAALTLCLFDAPGVYSQERAQEASDLNLTRSVAVTVDDLPATHLRFDDGRNASCNAAFLVDFTERFLEQLEQAGAPATGFVNEGGHICEALRLELLPELLRAWLDAGHELANHTYSHRSFEETGLAEFQADILKGETITSALLAERGRKIRYFRFPFLHISSDTAKDTAIRQFLADHGYTISHVTIDNDEWIYAFAHAKAIGRGDTALARRVGTDYVRYMAEAFAFSENLSNELFSREIPQILLLHVNPLNAEYFDELAAMMRERGYRFITLEEARTDKAYSLPDPYIGPRGLSWLQRLAAGTEAGIRREPQTPAWIREAAGVQ
jgi:peptidoglycan-N-acetylglucosamine deacetylase